MLPPLTFTGKEPGCFYLGEVILSLKRGERFAQGFSLSLAHTHIYKHITAGGVWEVGPEFEPRSVLFYRLQHPGPGCLNATCGPVFFFLSFILFVFF